MKPFLLGALLFCLILALTTFLHKPLLKDHIEADLREKITPILENDGIDPSLVTINGHNLDIPADIAAQISDENHDKLDRVIGAYIPPRSSEKTKKTPAQPVKKPQYAQAEFSILEDKSENPQSLTLKGKIDSEDTRQTILTSVAAAYPADKQPKIDDQLIIAENTVINADLSQLRSLVTSHLQTAEQAGVHYSADNISLQGIVESRQQESSVVKLANPLASPERPLENKLKVLPRELVDFRVERKEDNITVSGTLPSEKDRNSLLSLVKANAADAQITDKTTIAKRPAPQNWWQEQPQKFVPSLLKDSTGPAYVHYRPETFETNALFAKKANRDKLNRQLKSYPKQIKQNAELSVIPPVIEVAEKKSDPIQQEVVPPPPAPEPEIMPETKPEVAQSDELAKNLKLLPVYFKSSSSYISVEEDKKIKKAAEAILNSKAKNQGLTVGGYADQRGNAVNNKALSLERANAVRKKLIRLGIKSDRLIVNHFGEDTTEMNPDDHWKARRVEISLTPIKK